MSWFGGGECKVEHWRRFGWLENGWNKHDIIDKGNHQSNEMNLRAEVTAGAVKAFDAGLAPNENRFDPVEGAEAAAPDGLAEKLNVGTFSEF